MEPRQQPRSNRNLLIMLRLNHRRLKWMSLPIRWKASSKSECLAAISCPSDYLRDIGKCVYRPKWRRGKRLFHTCRDKFDFISCIPSAGAVVEITGSTAGPSRAAGPSRSPSPQPTAKRMRDESDSEDERPPQRMVRPRTAAYRPPTGNGLWHAVTAPLWSFVQGFRWGITGDSNNPPLSNDS